MQNEVAYPGRHETVHPMSSWIRPSLIPSAEPPVLAGATTQAQLAGELEAVMAVLLAKQQTLGAEFEAVWDSNTDALYER